jgi:hypothetical protein
MKYSVLLLMTYFATTLPISVTAVSDLKYLTPDAKQVIFQQRDIPDGVALRGHAKGATTYGYRIPSLLVTKKGSILAFTERRLGLHDHAQNDIVLRRSTDNGKKWSDDIVAYEDGTWDLWASFPSDAGRKDGQIAVSKDNGKTWRIVKIIPGPFAYSALQVSPDQSSLLCLYESDNYRSETLITIPFEEVRDKLSANMALVETKQKLVWHIPTTARFGDCEQ